MRSCCVGLFYPTDNWPFSPGPKWPFSPGANSGEKIESILTKIAPHFAGLLEDLVKTVFMMK